MVINYLFLFTYGLFIKIWSKQVTVCMMCVNQDINTISQKTLTLDFKIESMSVQSAFKKNRMIYRIKSIA